MKKVREGIIVEFSNKSQVKIQDLQRSLQSYIPDLGSTSGNNNEA